MLDMSEFDLGGFGPRDAARTLEAYSRMLAQMVGATRSSADEMSDLVEKANDIAYQRVLAKFSETERIKTSVAAAGVEARLKKEQKYYVEIGKANDKLAEEKRRHEDEAAKAENEKRKALGAKGLTKADKKRIEAEYKQRQKKEEELHKQRLKNAEDELKKAEDRREKYEKDNAKKLEKLGLRAKRRENQEIANEQMESAKKALTQSGLTLRERASGVFNALGKMKTGDAAAGVNLGKLGGGIVGALSLAINTMGDFAKQLFSTSEQIASYKASIDTRLQGSKNDTAYGSYWDRFTKDITGIAGVSPLIKQEDFAANVRKAVESGIAFNVEQRAFLQTISDRIANTFDAFDGDLARLIRIQQEDTTAGRLGMESALTAFLNRMYETTEYLTASLQTSVRSALLEAEALSDSRTAAALEFQTNKWLGSLYSLGMSQNAIQGIAQALGQVAAGQIQGISGGGYGNLMVMSANEAGLSIADLLAEGIDDSEMNSLMKSMVECLAGIYDETQGNRVVQQQIAQVYGLTAADLKAAAGLASNDTISSVSNYNLSYSDMTTRLFDMASTVQNRTSQSQLLSNVFSNIKYSMAAGISSTPALYGMMVAANMLDSVAGGLPVPAVTLPFVGGVDLHTTFANLMRSGALVGSIMDSIGNMIAAGTGGGWNMASMLNSLGVTKEVSSLKRGGSLDDLTPAQVSESGAVTMAANGSGDDVLNQTFAGAEDQKKEQMNAAESTADEDIERKVLNESMLKIYDLLLSVVDGTNAFSVKYSLLPNWTSGILS